MTPFPPMLALLRRSGELRKSSRAHDLDDPCRAVLSPVTAAGSQRGGNG